MSQYEKSNIYSVKKGFERYRTYIYNSCGISINLPKNDKFKNMYIVEQFRKSTDFFKTFLKNIEFVNISTNVLTDENKDNTVIFDVIGKNKIKIIYEHNDDHNIKDSNSHYTSTTCITTKSLVDKVFNYRTLNGQFLQYVFPDTFLKLYFDISENISWINDDNMILYPNYKKTYFNKDYVENIKNTKKNEDIDEYSDIPLSEIYFEGVIKCDNYNNLMVKFKNNEYDEIRKELIKSNYRSVMYLENKNSTKLKTIYETIIDFFKTKYDVPEDNVLIDLPVFNITNKKWLWIYFNVTIRDIYKGFYSVRPKPQGIGVIRLDELIKYMENTEGDYIYPTLDKMHSLYVNLKTINNMKIMDHCINPPEHIKIPEIINYKPTYNYKEKKEVNYEEIIKNNKFIGDITVYNITLGSNIVSSSRCGVNICCSINGVHLIISIIPDTFRFFYKIGNTAGEQIIKYINENKCDDLVMDDYTDYSIQSGDVNNLQYTIHITKIGEYKCNACNDRLSKNRLIDELLLYNKKQSIMRFETNMEIGNIILEHCKKNFVVTFHVIVYNIMRNVIINYQKKKLISNKYLPITKYARILKRILELEQKYNNARNIKYSYFKELLNEEFNKISFYNNTGNVFVDFDYDINCHYISVIGKEYIDSKNFNDYKFLIWYTGHDIDGLENIEKVMGSIEEHMNNIINKKLYVNRRGIFDIPFEKKDIRNIYGIDEEGVENYINNYVYNIFSLVDSSEEKRMLDKLIKSVDNCLNNRGLLYRSYTYHDISNVNFQTFHIHVTLKATLKVATSGTMSGIVNMGKSGNMKHEHSGSLMKDYFKFKSEIWKKYYNTYLIIKCNSKFAEQIKTKMEIIKELYSIREKEKNFGELTDLMVWLIKVKSIPDVFDEFSEEFMEEWMNKLLQCGNNYNTTITFLYNFIKYIPYYEKYSK